MSDPVLSLILQLRGIRKSIVSGKKTYKRAFAREVEQMNQMFDRWDKSSDDSIRQVDRIERFCAEFANACSQSERYKIPLRYAGSHHLGALPEASPVVTNVSHALNPPGTPQGDLRLSPAPSTSVALDGSLPEEGREYVPEHGPATRLRGDTQTRDVPPTEASRSRDRSLEDDDEDNTSADVANRSPSGEPGRGELLTEITFDEVYHHTIYTDFKNIIVEWPKDSQEFYIVTCQGCRKNWGAAPLRSAGAHLRSSAHEMPRRDSETVIRELGIRVTRCNIQVARKNNEEYLQLLKSGQYRVPEHYPEASSRANSGQVPHPAQ